MTQKGALLLHGLTSTPATIAPLAQSLASRGYKVETPLIAGHGKSLSDLAKCSKDEWYASVVAAYQRLKSSLAAGEQNKSPKIFCAGLSLGSLLTLKLALELEEQQTPLAGIACLSTPLKLPAFTEKFLIPISYFTPVKQLIQFTSKNWQKSVADPVGRAVYRSSSLQKTPVASARELQKLQREILPRLGSLKTPAILVHSKLDTIAPVSNVDLLIAQTKNAVRKVVRLKKSGHVITLDVEKDVVAENVCGFFDSL